MLQRPPASRLLGVAAGRRLTLAVLAVVAVFLLVELTRTSQSAPWGQAGAQTGEARRPDRIMAIAGQITGDSYGLYLFDRESAIITVYQWLPDRQRLRLLASRNCTFDLRLDDYKTEPSPRDIRKIVREAQSLSGGQSD